MLQRVGTHKNIVNLIGASSYKGKHMVKHARISQQGQRLFQKEAYCIETDFYEYFLRRPTGSYCRVLPGR